MHIVVLVLAPLLQRLATPRQPGKREQRTIGCGTMQRQCRALRRRLLPKQAIPLHVEELLHFQPIMWSSSTSWSLLVLLCLAASADARSAPSNGASDGQGTLAGCTGEGCEPAELDAALPQAAPPAAAAVDADGG